MMQKGGEAKSDFRWKGPSVHGHVNVDKSGSSSPSFLRDITVSIGGVSWSDAADATTIVPCTGLLGKHCRHRIRQRRSKADNADRDEAFS